MKVKKLIENINIKKIKNITLSELNKLSVTKVCNNSKCDVKNSLFVCVKGLNFDSHLICEQLYSKGVKIFVCEEELNLNVPYILVENTRSALGFLYANFYNNPITKMKLISVVGTNGKTTTTYLIQQILTNLNVKVGVIGTSGVFIDKKRLKETLTTPDPEVLNKLFFKMFKAGCEVVVIEVSAHAISLHKIDNLQSDITIFTNFSQDHLDFFKTMENYKQTKFQFFRNNTKVAIINVDDKVGIELFKELENKIPCFSYALENCANLSCEVVCKLAGSDLNIKYKNKCYKKFFPIVSKFNVYNLLSALLTCIVLGFKEEQLFNCIQKIKNIKGRFDVFKISNKTIIIDYAHTPESFSSIFNNIKNLTTQEIVSVFGCPGNRDETKREIMGKTASEFSKKVYLTTDNPKFENPLKIAHQIAKGCKNYEIILDRYLAIKTAIKKSSENDIILILGKGSESYQDINNIKMKYSDYDSLFRCIKKEKNK